MAITKRGVNVPGESVKAGLISSGVGGVQIPDTTKARGVLNQEFISRQTPGNSILDTINALPGVSFQNNDPFGSGGGTLTIRGFDSSRIAVTIFPRWCGISSIIETSRSP